MIQLIPLCIMAMADAVCPAVLAPHAMARFDLPFHVCIMNDSDVPGSYEFPKWTGDRTIIVSPNLRLCEDAKVSVR
jgi:hypothetical protein